MTESFINGTGVLPSTVEADLADYLANTIDKLITIDWKSVKPTRSLLQNKYYWGVVIAYLSKEIGYTPQVMHEYMKETFLSSSYLGMPDGEGIKYYPSTKTLSKKEFDDYIQQIRIWAGEFLSLDIPLPNQTQFNYTGYE